MQRGIHLLGHIKKPGQHAHKGVCIERRQWKTPKQQHTATCWVKPQTGTVGEHAAIVGRGNHRSRCFTPLRRFEPTPITGLRTGNGLAFSPDGRTMYLSDSHPSVQKIWAFDLDDAGQATRQRLFVDMQVHPGRPDGAAVDVDGCYWICGNDAGLVHRFTPDGKLDRSLAVPAAKPAMCAFGGPRLDRLYVTTIVPPAPMEGYEADLAGAVFVLDPQCTGLADAAFAA